MVGVHDVLQVGDSTLVFDLGERPDSSEPDRKARIIQFADQAWHSPSIAEFAKYPYRCLPHDDLRIVRSLDNSIDNFRVIVYVSEGSNDARLYGRASGVEEGIMIHVYQRHRPFGVAGIAHENDASDPYPPIYPLVPSESQECFIRPVQFLPFGTARKMGLPVVFLKLSNETVILNREGLHRRPIQQDDRCEE